MSTVGGNGSGFLSDKGAVQSLHSYCMSLPKGDLNEKNIPVYEYIETTMHGHVKYQCAILMPKVIPVHLRYAVGPLVDTKAEAKRVVCAQILGDIYQYEVNMAERIADGDVVSEYHRFLAKSGLSTVHLKVVPDKLVTQERNTKLFLYAIRAVPDNEKCSFCVLSCIGCCEHLKALNQVGLALVTPLNRDVLETTQKFSLRSSELIDVKFVFLGECLYSDEVINQMQRFHKAISCWENESREISDDVMENSTMSCSPCKSKCECIGECEFATKIPRFSHLFGLSHGKSEMTPLSEWGNSSNGSCYIFFPLPDSVCTLPLDAADLEIKPVELALLADESSFSMHLAKCADEAHTLVYNLRIQKKVNDSPSLIYYAPTNDQLTPNDLAGQIIARGSGDIFMGLQHQHYERVKLTDIIKAKHRVVKAEKAIELEDGEEEEDLHHAKKQRFDSENAVLNGATSNHASSVPGAVAAEMIPVTYGDNFISKNPSWRFSIEKLQALESHSLVSVMPIVSKLTVIPISGPLVDATATEACAPQRIIDQYNMTVAQSRGHPVNCGSATAVNMIDVSRYHNHSVAMHLLPETCHPLGKAKWFYFGLVAPCVAWRVQSILLGNECIEKLINCAEKYNCTASSDPIDIHKFASTSPNSLDMLRAITFRCAAESFDNERLECLGDSILKLATTINLFQRFPMSNEGALTKLRQDIINNESLSQKSRCLDLSKYMHAVSLSSGKQALQLRPPGMSGDSTLCMWNGDIIPKRFHQSHQIDRKRKNSKNANTDVIAVEGDVMNEICAADALKAADDRDYFKALYPRPQVLTVVVQDKLKADFVEALIGAYYLSGGLEASVNIIKLFRLFSPKVDDVSTASDNPELFIPSGYPENLLRQISRTKIGPRKTKLDVNRYCDGDEFGEFCISLAASNEELVTAMYNILGYRFKSIELLHQALTHDTMVDDPSNQRLEFLGDAILDFVVCLAIFTNCPTASCGDISLGKRILTNNKKLAQFAYKSQMYRYLRIGSRYLFNQFLRINDVFTTSGGALVGDIIRVDEELYRGGEQVSALNAEEDQFELFLGETSKPLADVMEAIIGAIYLDSNFDLTQVTNMLRHIQAVDFHGTS